MLRSVHPRTQNPPVLVAELIDETEGRWTREVVEEHMQPIDAQTVMQIPLPTMATEDCWAWHYERSGHFTVRSCYRMLKETKKRREDWLEGTGGNWDLEANKKHWCRLWGAKIPAKLKNFVWRLSQNSIPPEEVRFYRHMSDSNICKICNGAVDSWKHALIDCHLAKCVWSMVDDELVEHMISITTEDARLWLNELQYI